MAEEFYSIDKTPSSIDEHESNEDLFPAQIPSLSNKRYLDSAEKYFDWASKTNRKLFKTKKNNIHFLFIFLRSYGIFTWQTFLVLPEKR